MKDLQEKLSKAYNLLSAIPVTGDHVEIMAAARELLREAHKLAEEKEKVPDVQVTRRERNGV